MHKTRAKVAPYLGLTITSAQDQNISIPRALEHIRSLIHTSAQ